MVLPNFLGIGAPKCGSTWIHELLQQHPQVYMPTKRKEINYFNLEDNYQKGIEWYESFFPDEEEAKSYKSIGEFTPRYFYNPDKCLARIVELNTVNKLIIILRHPTKRTYSQYCHAVRAGQNRSTFQRFLDDKPWVVKHSLYASKIEPFLKHFAPEQICCLIFEEAIQDVEATKQLLAEFLEISYKDFPSNAGVKSANVSYLPRIKWLNHWTSELNRNLTAHDLDWIINFGRNLGVPKLLRIGATKIPPMTTETKVQLDEIFSEDIENLEKLLKINLDVWRAI